MPALANTSSSDIAVDLPLFKSSMRLSAMISSSVSKYALTAFSMRKVRVLSSSWAYESKSESISSSIRILIAFFIMYPFVDTLYYM